MFRMKNQECLQASIEEKKKVKKSFCFPLQQYGQKKALNVIFSPKMIIPENDPLTTIMNTHQKKRYQKETKTN